MDQSMDTMHLNDPLVIFGFEGSALILPLIFAIVFSNDKGLTFW